MRPKEVCEIIETVPNEVYGVSTDDNILLRPHPVRCVDFWITW